MMCFIHQKGRYAPHKILPKFLASAFRKAVAGDIVSRFLSSLFFGRSFLRVLPFACCICLWLFGLPDARSQSLGDQKVVTEGGGEVRPLKVGDTIPEELWNLPLQVVNHPEGKDTITLNDYRDKKLIILDFWATWCGSCIKNFPKMDSLNRLSSPDIQILLVNSVEGTGDTDLKIKSFYEKLKQPLELPSVINDIILKKFFPRKLIPHYVWLDENAKVRAITGSNDITMENITRILEDNNITISTKEY